MAFWEVAQTRGDQPAFIKDYAEIWQAADKSVYSRTLKAVTTARTRIEREFDAEGVRKMKALAGRDITVGGPHLARQAIRAGLVDELHIFVTPVVVGGGNEALPDDLRLDLERMGDRDFQTSVVQLPYRVRT